MINWSEALSRKYGLMAQDAASRRIGADASLMSAESGAARVDPQNQRDLAAAGLTAAETAEVAPNAAAGRFATRAGGQQNIAQANALDRGGETLFERLRGMFGGGGQNPAPQRNTLGFGVPGGSQVGSGQARLGFGAASTGPRTLSVGMGLGRATPQQQMTGSRMAGDDPLRFRTGRGML